jgi:hypothetical protein
MRNVVDEMSGQSDPANLVRRIEVLTDYLTLAEETDAGRILRRLFPSIITNPSDRSVEWMATVIGRRQEFFLEAPQENKDEFASRLRNALQNKESLSSTIVESLTNVANLMHVDLVSLETDTIATSTDELSEKK